MKGNVAFIGSNVDTFLDGKTLTPCECFQKFIITADMLQLLIENTNPYSVQKNGRLVNTHEKEIEQIIDILLKRGICRMPGNRAYWESDTLYLPVIDVMSKNRQ
ncbi:hypothetical protein SNE40_015979 [Patella caerulea]|uniref:PiggyBac transposable element-derived protein domain-containing protein n=1 Tax=Patella caerulea TaxID=87958 RepID=A0AAN8J923_PATCE